MNLSPRLLKEEVLILKLFSENPAWGYMTELSFDGIDREKLYFLLKKHKLLRAFASKVSDSPFDVPSDISRQIRNILLLADMEKQIYRETLERVGLIFDKAGITFCLIKGYSLGNIETARDVNDLDILIHEGDLERVDLLLKEKGFFYVGGERKAFMKKEDRCGDFASLKKWSNQFEYRNRKNDLLLEIHTHLFEKERVYPFEMGKIWEAGDAFLEKAEFAPSLNCLVLMPAHSLWLMAMHNAFRRTACRYMLTLRYISDMEYLIRRAKADWSVFLDTAVFTGTEGFALYSLEMTEYFYPGIIPVEVMDTLRRRLSRWKRFFLVIQHRCLLNLLESRRVYTVLYSLFLPFIYGGKGREKVRALLLGFRIFKPPVRRFIRERRRAGSRHG